MGRGRGRETGSPPPQRRSLRPRPPNFQDPVHGSPAQSALPRAESDTSTRSEGERAETRPHHAAPLAEEGPSAALVGAHLELLRLRDALADEEDDVDEDCDDVEVLRRKRAWIDLRQVQKRSG
jgi:hypothetical protein